VSQIVTRLIQFISPQTKTKDGIDSKAHQNNAQAALTCINVLAKKMGPLIPEVFKECFIVIIEKGALGHSNYRIQSAAATCLSKLW